MQLTSKQWIRISLFNLLLVAAAGVILRYKIAFALPIVEQKHLLHAHFHFAFSGWVTQILMTLLIVRISKVQTEPVSFKYNTLLFANLISAYGMLISFTLTGYGLISISFTLASIIVSYFFTYFYWKDLNKIQVPDIEHRWYKAGILFLSLSSLGSFALTFMMLNKFLQQNWSLAAQYFYLHFQYNGWFFFVCMGLFTGKIKTFLPAKALNHIFRMFAFAFFPAYLLSVLWFNFPVWIYIIIVISAFLQVAGWGWLVKLMLQKLALLKSSIPSHAGRIMTLSAIALSIKLLLQLGSVVPSLSILSYGFRPIIIGYLHLVLLGITSLFLLGYLLAGNHVTPSKTYLTGTFVFIAGIIINEMLLMIQGLAGLNYIVLPYIQESLLGAAIVLFTGILLINAGNKKSEKHERV